MLFPILISVLCSFLLSAVMIPLIIKFCRAYSLYDSVNARKIHSGNIPRLGGIAIAVSFILVACILFIKSDSLSARNVFPLLLSGSLIFVFGILDDIFELRAIYKLMVQLLASAIVVCNGFYFKQFFGIVPPCWFSKAVTFFWIVGIINAYNLIDGLDGLCGTLVVTSLITFGMMLYGEYNEGAVICFLIAASVCGFLVWNLPLPSAKIFMGDNGSQFLGFMVSTIPLYSAATKIEFSKPLLLLLIVAFPMLDMIASIWRRLRDHRPIMSPDRFHLHHKLLNVGFSKRQVLCVILAIQLEICASAFISTLIEKKSSIALLGISYSFMLAFFTVIHYANRAVLRKIRLENEMRNSGKVPEL